MICWFFPGSSTTACALCSDRTEAASALLELEADGVTAPPNKVVLKTDLVNVIEDGDGVEEFFQNSCHLWESHKRCASNH